MKHLRFLARTILVENNQIDQAVKSLNRILSSENVIATARRWETYERPYERRNRLSFQKCMTIYSNEIERKVTQPYEGGRTSESTSYLPSLFLSYIPILIIFTFYLILNTLFSHISYAYVIILASLFLTTNLIAFSILSAQIQYFSVYWRASLLANTFLIGFIVATNSGDVMRPFGLYMMVLSFFHTSEFLFTAMYNRHDVSTDSFLLNHSVEYGLAAAASWAEFAIEAILLPSLKRSLVSLYVGLFLVTFGELFRKLAMYTAGQSFNHYVQEKRRSDHILVQGGVYSICRHPSYLGWFAWSIGTQVLLANPICTLVYAVVSWNFFKSRIIYEEFYLIKFFGNEYIDYTKRVWSGIPFVKGFVYTDEALD